MDADSLIHLDHPADGFNRISGLSMLRYGPEVAVPRILETYRKFDIKQTFFVPAWCIEQYPKAIEAMLAGGHEVAHHGFIHENPHAGGRAQESYWLGRAIEVIEKFTGRRPRGSRAPLYNFSQSSPDLLLDQGILYDASLMGDDVPYILRAEKGDLIELPSHWGLDDWPQFVHTMDLDYMMPIKSPAGGIEVFRQEFDAMWQHGGLWVGVWHPFATGRLARWIEVEKLVEYMLEKGDVWFARMEDIAAHVRASMDDGSYVPRIDQLPYYPEAVTPLLRPAE
jgi:peptidoglycan/xylan/chitin deacetylase (PgdA/CDA1 family)